MSFSSEGLTLMIYKLFCRLWFITTWLQLTLNIHDSSVFKSFNYGYTSIYNFI